MNKSFKINYSFTVYLEAENEKEAHELLYGHLKPLIDSSVDYDRTDFCIQQYPYTTECRWCGKEFLFNEYDIDDSGLVACLHCGGTLETKGFII